ncbi:kinase-like domain-containing protein [Auriculariales sp. MPI-PUGE-AT-0066]|nr:kinase-like domain-containing protein [Auriculariales sp. MPI-PUGE-AT-0066]
MSPRPTPPSSPVSSASSLPSRSLSPTLSLPACSPSRSPSPTSSPPTSLSPSSVASTSLSFASESSKEEIFPVVDHNLYLEHQELGRGGFGRVVKAQDTNAIGDNTLVAVKMCYRDSLAMLINEVKILNCLLAKDPERRFEFVTDGTKQRIVHRIKTFTWPKGSTEVSCISFALMEKSIYDLLVDGANAYRLHPANVLELVKQMSGALQFLEKEGVVHGDLKSENILLQEAAVTISAGVVQLTTMNAKLADFGCSFAFAPKSDRQAIAVNCGTTMMLAPERLLRISSGPAGDIWSLGLSVLEWTAGTDSLAPLNCDTPGQILNGLQRLLGERLPPSMLEAAKSCAEFDATHPQGRRESRSQELHKAPLQAARRDVGFPTAISGQPTVGSGVTVGTRTFMGEQPCPMPFPSQFHVIASARLPHAGRRAGRSKEVQTAKPERAFNLALFPNGRKCHLRRCQSRPRIAYLLAYLLEKGKSKMAIIPLTYPKSFSIVRPPPPVPPEMAIGRCVYGYCYPNEAYNAFMLDNPEHTPTMPILKWDAMMAAAAQIGFRHSFARFESPWMRRRSSQAATQEDVICFATWTGNILTDLVLSDAQMEQLGNVLHLEGLPHWIPV